jgi:hypothetical protein
MDRWRRCGDSVPLDGIGPRLAADRKILILARRALLSEFPKCAYSRARNMLTRFRTRKHQNNSFLNRWLGTIGIYGNSKEEVMRPICRTKGLLTILRVNRFCSV